MTESEGPNTTGPLFIESTQHVDIPLSEIAIDPERFNVLSGLIEIRDTGRDIGPYLVQQFLQGRRLIITGEPATGKSALFFQILSSAKENADRLGIPFEKKTGQYDFVLELERRRRERLGLTGKLEDDEFNERIYNEIMTSDIFEVPAVGSKEKVDRGRSAVERVERNIASGRDNRSLLVSLYVSPLVQSYGEYIRAAVSHAPLKDVFRLLDKYGMDIEGVERSMHNAKQVKDIFSLMATGSHIANIRKEVINEIGDWHLEKQMENLNSNNPTSPIDIIEARAQGMSIVPLLPSDYSIVFSKFGVERTGTSEPFFERKAGIAKQQMVDQAVYMEWRYRDHLGIGPEKAIIAGNPFASKKTVYDFKPLLRRQQSE